MHRTRKAGRYEPDDIKRFEVLHRHLKRALGIAFRLGALGTMQKLTADWLDRSSAAVLFLVNRAVLLAALRQKYGKETYAVAFNAVPGKTTTDDSVTEYLVWLMDEQGHPLTGVPLKFVLDRPFDCWVTGGVTTGTRPPGYQPNPDFCAKSLVGLSVSFNEGEIIRGTYTESVDYPLAQRSAQATDAYTKNGNQQIQQQIQHEAQEAKPRI
jgi:hypothetical protein